MGSSTGSMVVRGLGYHSYRYHERRPFFVNVIPLNLYK